MNIKWKQKISDNFEKQLGTQLVIKIWYFETYMFFNKGNYLNTYFQGILDTEKN